MASQQHQNAAASTSSSSFLVGPAGFRISKRVQDDVRSSLKAAGVPLRVLADRLGIVEKRLNQFVNGSIRGEPEELQRVQDLLAHWLDTSRTIRYHGRLVTPIRKGPRKKLYQDNVEVHVRRLRIFEHIKKNGKEATKQAVFNSTAPTDLEKVAVEGGIFERDGVIRYCYEIIGIISHRYVEKNNLEYLVAWKELPMATSSWVHSCHMKCPELQCEYHRVNGLPEPHLSPFYTLATKAVLDYSFPPQASFEYVLKQTDETPVSLREILSSYLAPLPPWRTPKTIEYVGTDDVDYGALGDTVCSSIDCLYSSPSAPGTSIYDLGKQCRNKVSPPLRMLPRSRLTAADTYYSNHPGLDCDTVAKIAERHRLIHSKANTSRSNSTSADQTGHPLVVCQNKLDSSAYSQEPHTTPALPSQGNHQVCVTAVERQVNPARTKSGIPALQDLQKKQPVWIAGKDVKNVSVGRGYVKTYTCHQYAMRGCYFWTSCLVKSNFRPFDSSYGRSGTAVRVDDVEHDICVRWGTLQGDASSPVEVQLDQHKTKEQKQWHRDRKPLRKPSNKRERDEEPPDTASVAQTKTKKKDLHSLLNEEHFTSRPAGPFNRRNYNPAYEFMICVEEASPSAKMASHEMKQLRSPTKSSESQTESNSHQSEMNRNDEEFADCSKLCPVSLDELEWISETPNFGLLPYSSSV